MALTISNDGTNSILPLSGITQTVLRILSFRRSSALWKNTRGATASTLTLREGDGYSTHAASTAMFRNIYNTVKGYDSSKLMNICLPGMNSINGSVECENWCVYGDLNAYCDTAAIMSYGMAWAGSAPRCLSKGLAGEHLRLRGHGHESGEDILRPSRIRPELADL